MRNVIYYNAGAGSGKTYQLTELLAENINAGYKPSEFIITTFTNRAADDLKVRSREKLYMKGMPEMAALLDQAVIGTVHSLGEQFVRKYWYLLGLSPNMKVMDEDSTSFYINRSLAELPTAEELDFFHKFCQEFEIYRFKPFYGPNEDFWKEYLEKVIDKATSYRISDFKKSEEESIKRLKEVFCPDRDFTKTKSDYLPVIQILKDVDNGNGSKAALDRKKALHELEKKKEWDTKDFLALAKCIGEAPKGKIGKSFPEKDNAIAELLGIWHSHQLFAKIEKLVKIIFRIAQRWQHQYEKYKAERRILDFNDMERYFITLLELDAIKDEIRGRYKVLLVDEFQDSSPIQVDIFNHLSELVEKSYWCGDSKQAIYGFRGADTDLTEAIVGLIENANKENVRILDTSYRSEPDIVTLCNEIFTQVFSEKLEAEKVRLKPNKTKMAQGYNLHHWTSSEKSGTYLKTLPLRVKAFAETYQIPYKEIAILARSNDELATLSDAFNSYGIKVSHASGDLGNQKETELMKAILALVVDPKDYHARARVAWLITEGFYLPEMIESKIECEDDWLADNPLISQILSRRQNWVSQGVAMVIETIMVELNLRAVLKSWGPNWQQREDNIYQLMALADRYEQYCRTMAFGATINGFISWLKIVQAPSAGDSEGIVLSTYHGAKGLEWNNVILVSLEDNVLEEKSMVKREFFGIHEVRTQEPTSECIFPEMWIALLPNLFTGNRNVPGDIDKAVKDHSVFGDTCKKVLNESARLLYVGMTRAKQRLITYVPFHEGKNQHPMHTFVNLGIEVPILHNESEILDLYGTGHNVAVNSWPEEILESTANHDEWPVLKDLDLEGISETEYDSRYVAPSKAKGEIEVEVELELACRSGKRIKVEGKPEMDEVGNCIHNAYAAFQGEARHDLEVVERIARGFGFDKVLSDKQAIVDAYTWLANWLTEKYGAAEVVHHELPFMHEVGDQVVRGSMDLVWETSEGCVLVDFKTFPGGASSVMNPEHDHYAGKYGMQFLCYEEAIKASGRKVIASYVYYPVAGLLVNLNVKSK